MDSLEAILEKQGLVLDELGTVRGTNARLETVNPRFHRLRPVPFSLRKVDPSETPTEAK